jgi:glycosyltransferase involved in cell wall biosynthesis
MAIAPARLNRLDTSDLDVLHLHGDDWFYLRRRVATVRTFHGSALYEARFATRARRQVSQYVTYGLELIAGRLATSTYGVNPAPEPLQRIEGHLPLAVALPDRVSSERPGPPTILFVGTWEGRKRGRMLHRAFSRDVLPHVPDARLVMVSEHCEPGPGVDWVKRPSDAALAELYRTAWLFCMPSSYEGFGLPYIEAMSHGTPVITTPNPGSRFVLDGGRCGRIVAQERLGEEITSLIRDPGARAALAAVGRERAADFGWAALIDRHERAYRSAIARFGETGDRGAPGDRAATAAGRAAAAAARSAGRVTSQ